MNAKKIATLAKAATESKKGIDPVVLDLRKMSDVADYFVIVSGSSDRHVRTLADGVIEALGERNEKPAHVEGQTHGSWVLVDFVDVIVHVFHRDAREFYSLERLWGDTKPVRVKRPKKKSKHERPSKSIRRRHPA